MTLSNVYYIFVKIDKNNNKIDLRLKLNNVIV